MALYPDELIELLNAFLVDGVITDKERTALLKRAEKSGVDPDEFDLYIDSKVQELELACNQKSDEDSDDSDEDFYDPFKDDVEDDDSDIGVIASSEEYKKIAQILAAQANPYDEDDDDNMGHDDDDDGDDDEDDEEEDDDDDEDEDDEEEDDENEGLLSSLRGGRDTLTLKDTRDELKGRVNDLKDTFSFGLGSGKKKDGKKKGGIFDKFFK